MGPVLLGLVNQNGASFGVPHLCKHYALPRSMKRAILLLALALATVTRSYTDPQIPAPASDGTGRITMTGSAIRLVPNPKTANPLLCSSFLIQSLANNSNLIYVLNAPVGITMTYNTAGTTTVAQIGIGTSTAPGNSFNFPSNNPAGNDSGGTDLRLWGVYGTASDVVLATCAVRQ